MRKILFDTSKNHERIIIGDNDNVSFMVIPMIDRFLKSLTITKSYKNDLNTMREAFLNVKAKYIKCRINRDGEFHLSILTETQLKEEIQSQTILF